MIARAKTTDGGEAVVRLELGPNDVGCVVVER
jgi:hypothetical protein